MATLESIKHQFDIAIKHLDLFLPLINLTDSHSLENKDFALLKDAIQTFNLNYAYYTLGNVNLDKIVSDSKLFLELERRNRFYQFAHNEVTVRKNQLNDLISQMSPISDENVIKIENIFSECFSPSIKDFPFKGIGHNPDFIDDLINGIRSYFIEFESTVNKIKPKMSVSITSAKEEEEENDGGRIYLYKKGKKVMSDWKFLETTGTVGRLAKAGITFNPIHDFDKLKPFRLEKYEVAKKSFIEEREMNEVKTGDFELNVHLFSWFRSELLVIEQWLSDTYPKGQKKNKPSTSDQIEILKYKQHVNSEMQRLKELINTSNNLATSAEDKSNSKSTNVVITADDNISPTKGKILGRFEELDKQKGGLYAFDNEKDYNTFVQLLEGFFTYVHQNLPDEKIRVKKGAKTRLAKTLGEIHKDLSNEKSLMSDSKFFTIIKKLSCFENETDFALYKALTR